MLTQLGLNTVAVSLSDKIVALNYYIDGVSHTVDIDSSNVNNSLIRNADGSTKICSILTKTIVFSGINGTVNKVELVNSTGGVLASRNDTILLTSTKDLLIQFSFNISEI
jgi:hypothetical protein